MKTGSRRKSPWTAALSAPIAVMSLIAFAPGEARADEPYGDNPGDQPYDFSKKFYKKNGIKKKNLVLTILERGGGSGAVVEDSKPDKSRSKVRIIATNGGYDAGGALLYYPDPPAFLPVEAFRNGKKGQQARAIADEFRAFIFPRADGDPFSPGPPNRRQDNVFDTGLGYLTDNPLGLWTVEFVQYTEAALIGGTPEQDALMLTMAARNGLDEDGTPIIRRKHEIFTLEEAGLVNLYSRDKETFENGPPWVV